MTTGGNMPVALAPVVVICGHYGVGKTNFSLNLARDVAAAGFDVTLVDLDVVNPFFRSSDYRASLEALGVRVVAPVFSGPDTSLDVPSLSGAIEPAIETAQATWLSAEAGATDDEQSVCVGGSDDAPAAAESATPVERSRRQVVIVDAGGDDAGATALGRFARAIAAGPYQMLYLVNQRRNLTQDAASAACVLREIEEKSHLYATAVVNNTHLQSETDEQVVTRGIPFAQEVAHAVGLPLACTTVPAALAGAFIDRKDTLAGQENGRQAFYPVQVCVRTPWED